MREAAANKATERKIISDLRLSAAAVGRLYPVLVDKHGRVIDGKHRLKADPNWFKVVVPNVESEEHLLLLRLVTNVCRRNVPAAEKTKMLDELAQVYLEQGVPHNELIRKIVGKTGMSYRWVMKYASDDLKVRPGFGGPKSSRSVYQDRTVGYPVVEDELFLEPVERIANLVNYSNTNFATILVEKKFYRKFEQVAHTLGVSPEVIINNALLQTFRRISQLVA